MVSAVYGVLEPNPVTRAGFGLVYFLPDFVVMLRKHRGMFCAGIGRVSVVGHFFAPVAAGPFQARACTGALQKDLRRLAELFGGPVV